MTAQPKGRTPAPPLVLDGLPEFLVGQGLKGLPIAEQIEGFCHRVHDAGFPMRRANLGTGTLHPRYGAFTFVWRPGKGVELIRRERIHFGHDIYTKSPVYLMRNQGLNALRRRLDTGGPAEFMIFEELRKEGLTEYAARSISYGDSLSVSIEGRDGVFFSCATDRPEGFDDGQLEQVAAALPYLALGVKARSTYDVASTILETYLGRDAGRRVLTGEIERGTVETIRAVLWLCDLRDFTALADTLPRDSLVELLDDYLEEMARPVHENGGEILKFLGDGFLAIFDLTGIEDEAMGVCSRATNAARQLSQRFPVFNAARRSAGKPVMDFGLALHMGEVLYGNIGTAERLDFTVIGPAVNEASRIQALCRPLARNILFSSAYHEIAHNCRAYLRSAGFHALRGVREPQELFTLGG